VSSDSNEQALVILNAHPRLDEQIVDWLLQRETEIGFSSFQIRGHSGDHSNLTVTEQVSGRQKRMRFEIVIELERLDRFLDELIEAFAGSDVHYWTTPVLSSRDLNSARR
jgi:hypothetical protein